MPYSRLTGHTKVVALQLQRAVWCGVLCQGGSIDLCPLNAESPDDAVWNDTDSGGPLSCLQRDIPKVSGVWILAYCVVGDSVGSLA